MAKSTHQIDLNIVSVMIDTGLCITSNYTLSQAGTSLKEPRLKCPGANLYSTPKSLRVQVPEPQGSYTTAPVGPKYISYGHSIKGRSQYCPQNAINPEQAPRFWKPKVFAPSGEMDDIPGLIRLVLSELIRFCFNDPKQERACCAGA